MHFKKSHWLLKLSNHCNFWIVNWRIVTYHFLVFSVVLLWVSSVLWVVWQTSLCNVLGVVITLWGRDLRFILPRNIIHQGKTIKKVQLLSILIYASPITSGGSWRRSSTDLPPEPPNMHQVWLEYSSIISVNLSWVDYKLANNVTESIVTILPKTFSLIEVKWVSLFKLFLTDKCGSNALQWKMSRNLANSYFEISFELTDSYINRNF